MAGVKSVPIILLSIIILSQLQTVKAKEKTNMQAGAQSAQSQTSKTVDEWIKKLRAIEQQVGVIEYDIIWEEFSGYPDDKLKKIEPTGVHSRSHLIVEHGTERIYREHEGVFEAQGGPLLDDTQLLAVKFLYSFDGTASMELTFWGKGPKIGDYHSGPEGLISNEAWVGKENFPFHNTGLQIFPGFFERKGIVNTIADAKEYKIIEKSNGILEVHFLVKEILRPKKTFYQWEKAVLDMKKGGIITDIIGYDRIETDPNERPFEKMSVNYLQGTNGTWLPKSATKTIGAYGKKTVWKYTFENVKINHINPNKQTERFCINFPKNTTVLDKRSMKTYRVIGDDSFEPTDIKPFFNEELIGKLAPELNGIKAWKKGKPVRLAELRGKVVLLYFWAHWCRPCVTSMPKLMELHDNYKDKGLVIIAIHNNSVSSIEEMEAKLVESRKKLWAERDIPFLVALDGGDTLATYGIHALPTKLLVDRDGILLEQSDQPDFGIFKDNLIELLGEEKPLDL